MQSFRVLGGDIFGGELGLTRGTGGCVPFSKIDGSVAAGATFTHPADGVIGFTVTTLPSAPFNVVRFRKQDNTNYWRVRVDSAGSLVLGEVVSGVETVRGNVAGVVANGHRVVVVCDGTTIRVYSNNVLRITYSSASNFAAATTGDVSLATGGAISNLKTWQLACRASEGV